MRRWQRGFTLLETLVMLVVSALAIALMFQMLGGFNRARERVAALEGVRNNRSVLMGWWRDSIRSMVAVAAQPGQVILPDDPAGGLKGDAESLQSTSLMPLLGAMGVPTIVTWRIQREGAHALLEYAENGKSPIDFDLGEVEASFAYLDTSGAVSRDWPEQQGVQAVMPAAVELVLKDASGTQVVLQSIGIPYPLQPALYGPEAEK